jgi:hypothetical protein
MCRVRQFPGSLIPHAHKGTPRSPGSLGVAVVLATIGAEGLPVTLPGGEGRSATALALAGVIAIGVAAKTPAVDNEVSTARPALKDDALQRSSAGEHNSTPLVTRGILAPRDGLRRE